MNFKSVNTEFFTTYTDALKYLPTAIKNLKSELCTAKDQYCHEMFIGFWLHPFFLAGLGFFLFSGWPIWVFAAWAGLNVLLFHPDIEIF